MTTGEAIERLKQLDSMCPYLDATGNRVERSPFANALDMAIAALELQEGNLYMDDVKRNLQIGIVKTLHM